MGRGLFRRSGGPLKLAGQVAALVLVTALGVSAPASAKKAKLHGQVIGQPYTAKKRTAVLVLLDAKSARRAKLESRLGVLMVKAKRAKAGRTRIATLHLRMSDHVRTRTRLRR